MTDGQRSELQEGSDIDTRLDWYQGRKVVVAGGLGFIGSNLAIRLTTLGAQVVIIDSLVEGCGGCLENVVGYEDALTVSTADVRSLGRDRLLLKGSSVVFNLAASIGHLRSIRTPIDDLDLNARSALALLEDLRTESPRARVVFTSTRQVYGRPQSLPLVEDHPVRPIDINGIHKVAAEEYHRLYYQVYGQPTVVLRLTNTYGPRQSLWGRDQGFIPAFLRAGLEHRPIELYGDGNQRRDLAHVDDVVAALLQAGSGQDPVAGRIFNVGGEVTTVRSVAERVIAACGGGSITSVAWPEGAERIDIGDVWSADNRFRRAAGWTPSVPLAEGISSTVAFQRARLGCRR